MNRETMLYALENSAADWDICIIGGGATGLGIAVDAASRGFKTLLAEQHDFAKGTSSRSTKLIHGGVRYLQQGNIKLVMEGLRERGLLRKNAPHLVKDQAFILPNYKWWEGAFYGIGLKVYDWLAGRLGLGSSRILSKAAALRAAPSLNQKGLRGGVLYHDGQFDDARLAINLAQTAAEQGAVLLNYLEVTAVTKNAGKVDGLALRDAISGKSYSVKARVVINATGIFADSVLRMNEADAAPIMALSQGIHLVVDKEFLPGEAAIMIPSTDDGRVLFAVPWHNKTLIGTTDTAATRALLEPVALDTEIRFILSQIGRYLGKAPTINDVRSIFAGLRPLVKGNAKKTAELPRDHLIQVSDSGLVTVTGGKWTTYRRMAEDTINTAIRYGKLDNTPCKTNGLPIHGWLERVNDIDDRSYYGADRKAIDALIQRDPVLGEKIHPLLPYLKADIIWAMKEEMCMTLEDALSRRTRVLLLDAQAAIDVSEEVAALMKDYLQKDDEWMQQQVDSFQQLAKTYLPGFAGRNNHKI